MPFINEILKYNSVSIVGLEKNTGKTECLNYVLKRLSPSERRICVTSIGIDGEGLDQVTNTKKPEIELKEGYFFATSETHYRSKQILSEIYDISEERTALGRVVLALALSKGKTLISGPSSGASLTRWIARNKKFNIDLSIIDGALSRLSSASPAVSESIILSTGAALSANIDTLVDKTAYIVELIALPLAEEVYEPNEIKTYSSLLKIEGTIIEQKTKRVRISGALTDGFLKKFMSEKRYKEVELVVNDFSKIFLSPFLYRQFVSRGGKLKVAQKSHLLAITVNPTAPSGIVLNSDKLCEALSDRVKLPVYDIVKNKYEA